MRRWNKMLRTGLATPVGSRTHGEQLQCRVTTSACEKHTHIRGSPRGSPSSSFCFRQRVACLPPRGGLSTTFSPDCSPHPPKKQMARSLCLGLPQCQGLCELSSLSCLQTN